MATRIGFVAKKWGFPPQNGDEIEARRQKMGFSASKWRRERVSSSKNGVFRLKMATRTSFVVKIALFPTQNGDENEARRQKMGFSGSKW
jgi:aminoglycoside phosphotransferase